jgi:hypothetical protein
MTFRPSPSARRLFDLARGQDEPDATARNRVACALLAKIATGASLTTGDSPAPTQPTSSASTMARSLTAVGVVAALVTAGWLTSRTLRLPAPAVGSPHRADPVTEPAPMVVPQDMPSSEPLAPSGADSPPSGVTPGPGKAPVYERFAPPSTHPARERPREAARPEFAADPSTAGEPADRLRAETEALRLAQQALRDGSPQQALSLLDEQDLRFRDGLLQEERAAARALALCQAGRVGEARAQALRFERLWPRSALRARVHSACLTP